MGCVLGQKTSMPTSTYFHPLINRTSHFAVYIENWHTHFPPLSSIWAVDVEKSRVPKKPWFLHMAFFVVTVKPSQWWQWPEIWTPDQRPGEREAIECIRWSKRPFLTVFDNFQVPSKPSLAHFFFSKKRVRGGWYGVCRGSKKKYAYFDVFSPLINRTSQFAVYIEIWHTPLPPLSSIWAVDAEKYRVPPPPKKKNVIFATKNSVFFFVVVTVKPS